MKHASFAVLAAVALAAAPLRAQSLLYRPPNLGGTWVTDAGVVQLNFRHRLYERPALQYLVVNYPTFTLAPGLGHQLDLGARFATRSIVGLANGAQSTNETEVYGRWRVHGTEGQPGFAIAVTPAYNFLAKSVDGELGVDWTRGALTLHGAARGVSRRLGQLRKGAAAFAGGFNARLNPYVGASADIGSFGPAKGSWTGGRLDTTPCCGSCTTPATPARSATAGITRPNGPAAHTRPPCCPATSGSPSSPAPHPGYITLD